MSHALEKLPEGETLRRLIALNAELAEEEKRGLICWLRPEFQNPTGQSAGQGTLGIADKPAAGKARKAEKPPLAQTPRRASSSRPLRPRRPAQAGDRRGVVQAVQVGQGRKGGAIAGNAGGTGASKAG